MSGASTTRNVLIAPGAWAGESVLDPVISLLHVVGYSVTIAPIRMTRLADDVRTTRAILATLDGPTILVGYGIGGAVISGAATEAANAVALVYVSAFAPDESETIDDLLHKRGYVPEPGAQHLASLDHIGYIQVERTAFLKYVAQDIDCATARLMAVTQRPLHEQYMFEPAGVPAWKTLPTWWLLSSNDLMINPALQLYQAKRMGATILSVTSSHLSPMVHPKAIVGLIQEASDFTKVRG